MPIGEACLVSTLSSKAKEETEVQSPGCNVRKGRCSGGLMKNKHLNKIYSNGLGQCRMDKNLSLYCGEWKSLSMSQSTTQPIAYHVSS